MITLYKNDGRVLRYWMVWESSETGGIIYQGIVGQIGEQQKIVASSLSGLQSIIQTEIIKKGKEGFDPYNLKKFLSLEVSYAIIGFGTDADLERRHEIEGHLDSLMKFTGLGFSNGASTGNGSMEIGCKVINYDLARELIIESLADTDFANYTGIFRLSESLMN